MVGFRTPWQSLDLPRRAPGIYGFDPVRKPIPFDSHTRCRVKRKEDGQWYLGTVIGVYLDTNTRVVKLDKKKTTLTVPLHYLRPD